MSRELIGIGVLAILCIILSPLINTYHKSLIENRSIVVLDNKPLSDTIKTDKPKRIILISDSFLPKTFAGSELSAYETLKYLQARGHSVEVYVLQYETSKYDTIPISKLDYTNPQCKTDIISCDALFYQMGDMKSTHNILNERKTPVYMFIHVIQSYGWQIQNKMKFPCIVVYNSKYTQVELPTLHPNFIMYPYVNINKFKALQKTHRHNNVVCLINVNANKGGEILKSLALSMPDVQFIGVKGGYSNQVVDPNPPSNIIYMENQKDIRNVYSKIGILIMPSKDETWGRTAVEAMAVGIPVIHSESPGLIECLGGAGIMCLRNDETAWQEAITRLIKDKAYRETITQRGYKRVDEIDKHQRHSRQELALRIENSHSWSNSIPNTDSPKWVPLNGFP